MGPAGGEASVRAAAFEWLAEQVRLHDDVLPRRLLEQGFILGGERISLVGPAGIWKPRVLREVPLSITTVPGGPYPDRFDRNGLLEYRYRGTDPGHRDNVGLREAMRRGIPLVYFFGIVKGKYLPVWPVFVVGDDPAALTFVVAADDARYVSPRLDDAPRVADAGAEARRAYVTATVRQRLHQRGFRERVLHAYRNQCAFCRLRHEELLDAAHIVPDRDPEGLPVVTNGLALCKLHHAAFDRHFLAVRPDYRIHVRRDILEEEDGPMLMHGLKGMHDALIVLPRDAALRPDVGLLARRYGEFRATA